MKEIPIDQLEISDLNVRQQPYPQDDLEDSIEKHGVLNPLLVVESDSSGKYGIICGSMRFYAARSVGLKTVPCVIRNLSDEQAIVLSLTENIQRGDLTLVEEADGVAKLYEIWESQTKVAEALGKGRDYVRQLLTSKGIIDTYKEIKERDGAHVPNSELPRDKLKTREIAGVATTLFPDDMEKQAELFESLKDKTRRDVRRASNHLRAEMEDEPETFDNKDLQEIVADAFRIAKIDVKITFSAKLSKGIEKVVEEREIAYEDVVEIAIEQWLKQEGYL